MSYSCCQAGWWGKRRAGGQTGRLAGKLAGRRANWRTVAPAMPVALVVSTMPAAPVVLAAPVVSAALSEKMHVANDWERGKSAPASSIANPILRFSKLLFVLCHFGTPRSLSHRSQRADFQTTALSARAPTPHAYPCARPPRTRRRPSRAGRAYSSRDSNTGGIASSRSVASAAPSRLRANP